MTGLNCFDDMPKMVRQWNLPTDISGRSYDILNEMIRDGVCGKHEFQLTKAWEVQRQRESNLVALEMTEGDRNSPVSA